MAVFLISQRTADVLWSSRQGARAAVLQAAYAAKPERFVRRPPTPPKLPTAAWINPPESERKEAEMGQ